MIAVLTIAIILMLFLAGAAFAHVVIAEARFAREIEAIRTTKQRAEPAAMMTRVVYGSEIILV